MMQHGMMPHGMAPGMPPGGPGYGMTTKDRVMPQIPQVVIARPLNLPIDVQTALNKYQRIYIAREVDSFRNVHCCENFARDFKVYGHDPMNADKNLLFTVRYHFECCNVCNSCIITCLVCDYICCDKIIFQLDYKKNGLPFYTQGVNLIKGCYFCKCIWCQLLPCCVWTRDLYLRENTEPDLPDFNVGVKTGKTSLTDCCGCCNYSVKYIGEDGTPGHTLKMDCCRVCQAKFCPGCTACRDDEIEILDPNGNKVGNIFSPHGCCSMNVPNCCYCSGRYYDISLPQRISSFEKFQIISEAVHFAMESGMI